MYSVYGDGVCIYNDLHLAGAVNAITPNLKLADNTAGTFEITLPVGNAGYDLLERLSSEIVVKRYDEEIWSGRIISEKVNFQNSRILTCEGELAYLNDTTQAPREYDNVEIYDFLLSILSEHNSKVGTDKQFNIESLGSVTVHGTISYVTNNETTMNLITEKLLNVYGGHIRVRKVDGVRYLDYLKEYPNTSAQEIRFGSNLLDFSKDFDMTDIATVIRPRGAKINDMSTSQLEKIGYTETEIAELRALSEKVDICLDVTKVNDRSPYVTNEDGISAFGWIEAIVDWDGITNPEELLEKAQSYLSEEQFDNMVIEVSAVDLRYLSKDVQSINLLDTVRCVSRPHGMDRPFPVTELNIQLDNPESSTYKLGDRVNETFTGSSRTENAEILDKISKIPKEKTILDKAKDNASQILNLATQGYVTIIKNQYGSQSLVVSADKTYNPKTDLWSPSTKLWKWNINGLGYSTDGGQTYGTAITMNGEIVADYITTGTMSADRVRAGILESSESYDQWLSTKYYNISDGVIYNNKVWRAVQDAVKGKEPGVIAWSETSNSSGAIEWEYSTEYTIGTIVLYDGKYWVAEVVNQGYFPGRVYWIETNKKNVVFNLNTGSLSISSGSMSLGISDSGTYKFQVNDDGYLTAEYGKIGGFTINADSIYNSVLNLSSHGLKFHMGDELLGTYGTSQYFGQTGIKGLTVRLENDTGFIAWEHLDYSTDEFYTIKLMYTSKELIDHNGGNFLADRIHLGTYMQLDHYGFKYKGKESGMAYISTTLMEDNGELEKCIELVFNLRQTKTGDIRFDTLQCYICNGAIMVRDI